MTTENTIALIASLLGGLFGLLGGLFAMWKAVGIAAIKGSFELQVEKLRTEAATELERLKAQIARDRKSAKIAAAEWDVIDQAITTCWWGAQVIKDEVQKLTRGPNYDKKMAIETIEPIAEKIVESYRTSGSLLPEEARRAVHAVKTLALSAVAHIRGTNDDDGRIEESKDLLKTVHADLTELQSQLMGSRPQQVSFVERRLLRAATQEESP